MGEGIWTIGDCPQGVQAELARSLGKSSAEFKKGMKEGSTGDEESESKAEKSE